MKTRLLGWRVQRISGDGVVVIKAQDHRNLERNRADAVARLRDQIAQAAHAPKARRATRPTRGSQWRRVEGKVQRGQSKALRSKVGGHDQEPGRARMKKGGHLAAPALSNPEA